MNGDLRWNVAGAGGKREREVELDKFAQLRLTVGGDLCQNI